MEKRNSIFAEVLELLDNFIFEYIPTADELSFYVVSNGREVLARKISDFKEWKESFPADHVPEEERDSFVKLCDDIIELKSVGTNFHTDFFSGERGSFDHFNIVGKKHTNSDGSETLVGYVSSADQAVIDCCRQTLGVEFVKDVGVDVYNKKSILEYCRHYIEENPGKVFFLALFDIDNFKNINDNFGHFFGDDVLVETTEVLKEAIKDTGKIGRVGGDEFLVIFDQVSDREEMRLILKNAREQVEAKFKGRTGDFTLTCSAGCCPYPECGETFEEIYKVADAFLYLAKEKGRNRYILYRDDLHKELVKNVISAQGESGVAQIYGEMSAKWNTNTIMERIISEYYVEGTMSLTELLALIENRFLVDFIQIVTNEKKILLERVNRKNIENDKYDEILEMNDAFRDEFMGNNSFIANSLASMRNAESSGKEFMKKNKIQNAIFYRLGDEGYILLAKRHDNRKWAEQDSVILTTAAQLISLKI